MMKTEDRAEFVRFIKSALAFWKAEVPGLTPSVWWQARQAFGMEPPLKKVWSGKNAFTSTGQEWR